MQAVLLSREEVARQASALYDQRIRSQVETEENIGKIVVIDIETGNFALDERGLASGLASANALRAKNPDARLFGIRIGYDVAAVFGGIMERTNR